MKLYGSLTSPYVRKARILIKEKDIDCDFVVVDAWSPDSPVPKLNPLGKVPVLERDDGEALYDSPVILEYLDARKAPALLAASGEARWRMLRIQALADGILDAVVARLLETRKPPAEQSAGAIEREERRVARALEAAAKIEKGEVYIMEDRFTLADLTLAVALEYVDFRYSHPWRDRNPRLALWLAGIMTRPSFAGTEPPGAGRAADSPR